MFPWGQPKTSLATQGVFLVVVALRGLGPLEKLFLSHSFFF